jgi:hypothetical protein
MSNRPSGILTPTDHEFLRNAPDYYDGENARQSRYQRRTDIRRRIVTSLLDFQEINTYLDDEQRRKIFAEPEKNGAEDDLEFRAALQSLLQWMYLGCREEGSSFESLLTNAVSRAEEDYQRMHGGEIVDVDVEFNVEVSAKYEGVEELANRLEEGKPLLARNLYKVPMVGDVPVDPEKVDVVRIQPESAQIRPEREKAIVDAILQEHLGIDAEIEVVGIVDTDDLPGYGEDYEEPTGAVDREDYRGGTADDPGS